MTASKLIGGSRVSPTSPLLLPAFPALTPPAGAGGAAPGPAADRGPAGCGNFIGRGRPTRSAAGPLPLPTSPAPTSPQVPGAGAGAAGPSSPGVGPAEISWGQPSAGLTATQHRAPTPVLQLDPRSCAVPVRGAGLGSSDNRDVERTYRAGNVPLSSPVGALGALVRSDRNHAQSSVLLRPGHPPH